MHQHTIQGGRITLTFHGIKEEDIKEGQQGTQPSGSQYARPNTFPYQQQQPAIVTPQSALTYANPSMPPPEFRSEQKLNTMEKNFNSFMQSTNQLLESNQQAMQ